MSSKIRPIKVTNLDSDKVRANEINIENSKTGKVTAVVAVMYLFREKICNSHNANPEPLANNQRREFKFPNEVFFPMTRGRFPSDISKLDSHK